VDARPVRRVARALGCWLMATLFIVLIAVSGAGFGIWSAIDSARPGFLRALPELSKSLPKVAGLRPYTLADLPQMNAWGRQALDVPPPAGGYASFDPVDQLPWALRIAQAWSKDARLDRIDASRIRPDGTVDAATDADAEVMYRFLSPSRMAKYWREADSRADAKADCELWVIAKQGTAAVQLLSSRPHQEKVPPHPKVASLRTIVTRNQKRLASRPFYNAYMIHSGGRDGWVWYMTTLSGRDNLPRLRASDGRAWPW
jgi:hypothetical protein